jgi:carbon monoxide dehydrogenase subunit G
MIHVQRRVHLDPTPDEVFAYLTDVERIPEWQAEAGIRRVTRSDTGPMGVGSTFRMERHAQGRTAGIDATMNLWEPTHRFAFDTLDDAKFAGHFDTQLEPGSGGGTDLTWTVDMRPPGLWRLMSPVIRRAIDKAADVDFANLQRKLART